MLLAAAVATVLTDPVSAHFFLGNDSVDGSEIAWEDNTTYDTERVHANGTWDALGHINIIPDDPWRIQDLRWNNSNDCSYAGLWVPSSGSDDIYLSTCTFNEYSYTEFQRKGTAAHELGHALGLGHNTSDSTQLMQPCSRCSGKNTPQSHDQQDYNELWG